MVTPPSGAPSLEGGDQGFNGGDGQDRGLGAGFGGEIGAGDGDVGDHAGEDFDLAVADMAREAGESRQLERLAEERMTGIGDGDFSLAFLRDQRGITLGEVSPSRDYQQDNSCIFVQSTRNAPAPGSWAWTVAA
jgi:hypothetical protein